MARFAKTARQMSSFIVLGLLLAMSSARLPAQSHEPPLGSPEYEYIQLQILSPSEGADFEPYARNVLFWIRRKWTENLPSEALSGEKAEVVILVTIHKDGTIADPEPAIEISSKTKDLDDAALHAVRGAAPFKHLPRGFSGTEMKFRIYFLYNLPPGKLKPIATGG